MKHLFFLLFAVFFAFTVSAQTQSGTGTLSGTKSSVNGGDNNAKIVSYAWAASGVQAGPMVIADPTAVTTTVTVSVPGTYKVNLTVTDNQGNTSTTTATFVAYLQQSVNADASASSGTIIIKKQ